MKDFCLCGEIETRLLFTAGPYRIAQCVDCGQVRTLTPRGAPHTQLYQQSDVSIYLDKEQVFRQIFVRIINFIKRFKTSGVLIDIGAGVGLLVDEANKAGFVAGGFEPSRAATIVAKKNFGVKLINKQFTAKNSFGNYDVVVINHVLEHLPHPVRVIRQVFQTLRRSGLLVVGVPNFGSFLACIKKARWQSLSPDQHRWHFTLRALDKLILHYGFERKGLLGENHDRSIHPWWKRPIYWVLDRLAILTGRSEAILVVYLKK